MKAIKKILAMVLAASILLSTAPVAFAAEVGNTIGDDVGISDLMNVHKVNPLTGNETEPFNTAPGASILMSKENELLLYTSNKKGVSAKDDFITLFEQMDQSTSYAGDGSVSPELDLFFVTAVALVVAVAAMGAVAASKKNKAPAESEDEE